MELFRVPLWDMPLVASVNRLQWDTEDDFTQVGKQVWLTDSGRKKAIEVHERRKEDRWKHPVTGYSLSYTRLIELEARLFGPENPDCLLGYVCVERSSMAEGRFWDLVCYDIRDPKRWRRCFKLLKGYGEGLQ